MKPCRTVIIILLFIAVIIIITVYVGKNSKQVQEKFIRWKIFSSVKPEYGKIY